MSGARTSQVIITWWTPRQVEWNVREAHSSGKAATEWTNSPARPRSNPRGDHHAELFSFAVSRTPADRRDKP